MNRLTATDRTIDIALVLCFLFGIAAPPCARAQVDVSVDWSREVGEVTAEHLNLNIWSGLDPDVSGTGQYQDNLAYFAPQIVRLHASQLVQDSRDQGRGWTDVSVRGWDAAKINAALTAISPHAQDVLINIPRWPAWMDENDDGRLDEGREDEYAALCAELVQLVNVEQGHRVRYWTPLNELEGRYNGQIERLADIYVRCATAMKAVDPTILLGGAEWTQPWAAGLETFVERTREHLDFFTYHNYATGDPNASYADLFSRAAGMSGGAERVRSVLDQAGLDDIPVWLTEHNIYWSWDLDTRGVMRGQQGAVFHALFLKSIAMSGAASATMIWNDRDGTYGAMAPSYDVRPVGHLLHLKSTFLVGPVAPSVSAREDVVAALAVEGSRGRGVLLANRTGIPQQVSMQMSGWTPVDSVYEVHEISAAGYIKTELPRSSEEETVALDPYVLKLLLFDPRAPSSLPDVPDESVAALLGPYPNPSTGTATVTLLAREPLHVTVRLYDALGRAQQTLFEGTPAGPLDLTFSTSHLASGTYFVRLESGGAVETSALVVLR